MALLRNVVLIALLALLSFGCTGDDDAITAEAHLESGRERHQEGLLEEAVAKYSEAISLDSNDPLGFALRALAYVSLGLDEESRSDAEQALGLGFERDELESELATRYFNRANTHAASSEYTRAIEDYDLAIGLNATARAFSNRGLAYYYLEEYALALQDIDEAIRNDPELAEAYANRGLVYAAQDGYTQALANYSKAIEIDPEFGEAYGGRAIVYTQLSLGAEAVADVERAADLGVDREMLVREIEQIIQERGLRE